MLIRFVLLDIFQKTNAQDNIYTTKIIIFIYILKGSLYKNECGNEHIRNNETALKNYLTNHFVCL